jgi:2-hydroxy-3-keto-5-methylthiopentenyl-1-phosphate phosphatase
MLSGMAPLIRAVLSKLIGDEEAKNIEIVANDVEVNADGSWEIKYRHPTSGFGHDKSQAILPYRALPDPPTIFFFGDGVSGMLSSDSSVLR